MSLITILATQAGFTEDDCNSPDLFKIIARFAELVREDEREQMSSICKDVIAKEREACAKLCESMAHEWGSCALMDCATEIRGRTE